MTVLTEFMRLSLLSFSPMVRMGRAALFSFGPILAVFAVWALDGFAYPNAPVPFTLNVLPKIIAFVAAITPFLPQRARAGAPAKSSSTLSYAGRSAE